MNQTVSYSKAFQLLNRYLGAERGRAILLFILLITGIGLQLLQPQILRDFIDVATREIPAARLFSLTVLPTIAVLYIITAILNQLLLAAAAYVTQDIRWRTTNALRADLAQHALSLDMRFHNDRTAGELVSRIDGDVDGLSNFFSQFIIQVLGNGLLILGVLVILLGEDWRIGAGFIGFITIATIIIRYTIGLAAPWLKRFWEIFGVYFGFFEERLAGIEDIRANGGVAYTMKRYHELLRFAFKIDRNAFVLSLIPAGTTLGLFNIATALGLGLGGWLYLRGAVTIGTVYLLLNYTQLIQDPLRRLTQQLQDFQRAVASANRIQTLYFTESALNANPDAPFPLDQNAPELRFDNVNFHYAEGTPVLQNLSFTLAPGKVLGLLGRTGSGKTTITRLLFRLYDVIGGSVQLDSHNIADLPLDQLRRHIGMVTQEVQLFNATVRDNLTFFDDTISDDRILTALHDLELTAWFANLENGLDTMLESGGGLSAGEAQLLAFTRIFLANPQIILLDEASSRLDPATERLIERAIDKLLHNRTTIIVAHRLATVQRADDILILEDGKIREHGARLDLLQNPNSRFSQLLATGAQEVLI